MRTAIGSSQSATMGVQNSHLLIVERPDYLSTSPTCIRVSDIQEWEPGKEVFALSTEERPAPNRFSLFVALEADGGPSSYVGSTDRTAEIRLDEHNKGWEPATQGKQ